MLKRLKEISKDTLIYGFGQGLNGLISFILLPVYTQYLSPNDYGYLSMFEVFRTLVDMLIGFGIASALYRYYYYSEDPGERKSVVSTGFWMLISISGLLLTLVIPFRGWIAVQLVGSREYGRYVALALATSVCFNVTAYQMYLSRIRRRPLSFLLVQVALSLLRIGLNILFVVVLRYNFRGILWGNFIANAAVTFLMVVLWAPRNIDFHVSRYYIKKMLTFSVPILAANLIFYFQNSFDRVLITRFLDLTANGLYSFGSKIGSIVFFGFITPFKTAWPPYVMSIFNERDSRQAYANILSVFAGTSLLLSSVLVLFDKEVVKVIGHGNFDLAASIIPYIAYGNYFRGLYYTVSIGTDLAEKTHLSMYAQIIGTATSLALNFLLIPRIGIHGAGVAFLVSNALILSAVYVLSQKVYPIPYRLMRFLLLICVNGILVVLPIDSLLIKSLLFILMAIVTFVTVFFGQILNRVKNV